MVGKDGRDQADVDVLPLPGDRDSMKRSIAQSFGIVLLAGTLLQLGCGAQSTASPANSGSTVDQVTTIVAAQCGVDRSGVSSSTSLGQLGADDLDFVEIVLGLESHFGISLPDEEMDPMIESPGGVTIARLAQLVDEQKSRQ
jgi:acyl carrier protein